MSDKELLYKMHKKRKQAHGQKILKSLRASMDISQKVTQKWPTGIQLSTTNHQENANQNQMRYHLT
jgi:hypothetical protein